MWISADWRRSTPSCATVGARAVNRSGGRCAPPVNPARRRRSRPWPLGCRSDHLANDSACPPPSALCPPFSTARPPAWPLGPCASPTHRRHCRAGGQEELQAAREGRPPPQTAYRPRLGNIAPRVQDWEPRRGNTQTPPLTGPVRSRRCPLLACGKHAGLGTPRRLAYPASLPCCPALATCRTRTKSRCSSSRGRRCSRNGRQRILDHGGTAAAVWSHPQAWRTTIEASSALLLMHAWLELLRALNARRQLPVPVT